MSHEATYFDALKRITKYQTVDQLRRRAQKDYGLSFEEALEYAYENVIQEAHNALRGKRRPKSQGAATPVRHEAAEAQPLQNSQ